MKKMLVLFFTVLSLCLGQSVTAMDDDNPLDIAKLFTKSAEETTEEQKILSTVDAASLMALLETSKISRTRALLILINTTPGSGEKCEEKINALIQWHNTNKPDVNFSQSDNIWKLVRNYAPNQSLVREQRIQSLPAWIEWFINHGLHRADGSPLITSGGADSVIDLAISYDYPAVVTILLKYGQKPSDNAVHYAIQKKLKNTLAVLPQDQVARVSGSRTIGTISSANPQAGTSTTVVTPTTASPAQPDWDTFVKSKTIYPTAIFNTFIANGDEQLVIDDLREKNIESFKNFTTNANKVVLQKIKTDLEQDKSNVTDYAEKIRYIESVINPKSFSFSGLKAGLGIIAAAITANAFYKWFTRKPAQHQQENIIINKTGAPLFIDGQTIAINETFALPQHGEVRIKLAQDQDQSKDLVINMDAYNNDLNDSYLNLIIYKKWFSSLFTIPLTTSEVWLDKQASENKAKMKDL